MALLDDLKKQAQQKSAQEAQDSSKTLQGSEVNWHFIAPKLFTMKDYFKELVETLNVVEPEDDYQFTLTRGVVFRNLKKRNFKFLVDQKGDGRSFMLRYELIGELNQRLSVSNETMINKIRSLLQELTMKFNETNESMSKCTFVIKPQFTTRVRCEANLQERLINLSLENFEKPGIQQIRFKPDLVNDDFMEEVAKYLLGKPNKFMELAGYTMPEDLRRQLQEKLNRGKQAKEERAAKVETRLETTASKLKNIFKR